MKLGGGGVGVWADLLWLAQTHHLCDSDTNAAEAAYPY